jgi:pheromone shutdown protein TraB
MSGLSLEILLVLLLLSMAQSYTGRGEHHKDKQHLEENEKLEERSESWEERMHGLYKIILEEREFFLTQNTCSQ